MRHIKYNRRGVIAFQGVFCLVITGYLPNRPGKDDLKKKVSVNRRQKTKEEVPSEEEDEEEGETEEESDDESFDEEGTSFKSGNGIKQFSSLMHSSMPILAAIQLPLKLHVN